jgi:tetratricopeptide (TPR) repeat protein
MSLVAVLLACSIAQADQARATAEEHAKTAEGYFREARYQDALEAYTRAWDVLPLAAFLFDIGQCHRQLDECDEAIESFEAFLPHATNAADRQAAEGMIADCKSGVSKSINLFGPDEEIKLLAAKGDPIKAPPVAVAPPPPPPPPEVEPPPPPPPEVAPPPAIAEVEEEDNAVYEEWWFWTAIGGAVVIIAGGTAIGLSARGEEIVELPRGSAGTIDWR